jgi:hypothetical protein
MTARPSWRLGELIAQEQKAGRLATKGHPEQMSSTATLADLGIPRDRSARAQKLARYCRIRA